ncbi:MAG: DUF5011 domain-containing protein [Opitutae bacterium]|nr:DUF5011 domain-containing protein [Opitutae bacterium]
MRVAFSTILPFSLLAIVVCLGSTVRKDDLVLYFPFNETEGAMAFDASANSFEGTVSGDPLWEAGKFGNALHLDGVNDQVIVNHDVKFDLAAYTVSVWIKPEKNNENWTGVIGRQGRCYNFWLNRSNQNDWGIHHRFWDQASSNSGAPDSPTFIMGEWHLVTLTNDATIARTYVNGTLRTEGPVNGPLENSTGNLFIGSKPDGGNSNYFQGMIDDLRLYGVALNESEVAKVYGHSEGDFRVLTSTRVTGGIVGEEFTYPVTVDVEATAYAVEGLPVGLVIDADTGTVSGLPTETGSFAVSLTITTDEGDIAESFLINISDGTTFAFNPSAGNLEINTDTGKVLHDIDGEIIPLAQETKDGISTLVFDSFQVSDQVTVTLVGGNRLSIRTIDGDIIISTHLNATGGNGATTNFSIAQGRVGGGNGSPGRQWNSESANRGKGEGGGYTYRYAGAGASHGGLGGRMGRNNGQRWTDNNPWPPESPSTYGDPAISTLLAGSGGGSTHRAGGGAGGGGIELAAGGAGKVHITATGRITVNGGNAGNENHPETAGAGSGGAIKLSGVSINNEGVLGASGGVSVRSNNDWGGESSGGNGGGGRIAFHTAGELNIGDVNVSGGGYVSNYGTLITGGELIADSIEEFSGTQGGDGWQYGYSTVFNSYDPLDFNLFPGGTGEGDWSETQFWTGKDDNKVGIWDFKPADGNGNPPWTNITITGSHPNSGAGVHHSSIRRWVSDVEGAIGLDGYFHNTSANGNGTRGNIYLNGQLISSTWTDGFRTDFHHVLTVARDDQLDFLTDTGNTNTDGSDGTLFHVRIYKSPTTTYGRLVNPKRIAGYHAQVATAGTISIVGQTGKNTLDYSEGLLTIDTTSALWRHSSGDWGIGSFVEETASISGRDVNVIKVVFELTSINLGPAVGVNLIGEYPLVLKTKDAGDILLNTPIDASGGSAVPGFNWYSPGGNGILGGADGGIRGRDNNGTVAPSIFDGNGPGYGSDGRHGGAGAGYGGVGGRGRGGNGGEAGQTYGTIDIPFLLGGSGGGGGETGSGSGGGGAIELNADGNLTINADLSVNGGESPNGDRNGGGGSGGSIKLIGNNININNAAIESRGGDVRMVNGSFDRRAGAGGGGRIYIGYRNDFTLNHPLDKFPDTGLYSRWEFEEGQGSVATDSQGRNPGELEASMVGVSWIESPLPNSGKALYFDGVDDYVDVGVTGIKGSVARTIAGWVKSDTTAFDAWTGVFGFSGATTNEYFDFEIDNVGHYTLHVYGAQYPVTPLDMRWHHLAASYDGTNIRIYLDGNFRRSVERTLNTTDGFFIGGRPTHGTLFNGIIDDVCLWDRVLTDQEVMDLVRVNRLVSARGGNDSRYGSAQDGTVLIIEEAGQPVITRTGDAEIIHEGGTVYEDAGVTVADSKGEVLDASNVVIDGLPDGMKTGQFLVTYNYTDDRGSPATEVTRIVNVVDTIAPSLTLVGSGTVQVVVGDAYVDAGATALDVVDGILLPTPLSEKPVFTFVPGLMKGHVGGNINTTTVNPGNWGVEALGPLDSELKTGGAWGGNRTIIYSGQIYNEDGIMSFYENIDDKVWLKVKDQIVLNNGGWNQATNKKIDLGGGGWFNFELRLANGGGGFGPAVADKTGFGWDSAGVFDTNNADDYTPPRNADATTGDVFRYPTIHHDQIDTTEEGSFKITYTVIDAKGNESTVERIIEVVPEITTPVITLTGEVTVIHEAGTSYVDAGATVADSNGAPLDVAKLVVGGLPTEEFGPGVYLVTFDYEDDNLGKANQIHRTVTVVDTTPPSLTLVGEAEVHHQVGTFFNDPGVNAMDTVAGEVPVYSSEVFSANKLLHKGFMIAERQDSNMNFTNDGGLFAETPVAQTVFTEGPGQRGIAFNNDGDFRNAGVGISRNDNYQNLWTGLFKARIDGAYEFGISVKDDRTVFWVDLDQDGIFSRIGSKGDERLNNGLATGFRTVQMTKGLYRVAIGHMEYGGGSRITAQFKTPENAGPTARTIVKPADLGQDGLWGIAEPLDIWKPGTYRITYEANDSFGNVATIERTVVVEELPASPVITLTGENPLTHEAGPEYTDPGATVADGNDNAMDPSRLKIEGMVDSRKPGDYELVYTYITDAGLEATPAKRTVRVVDSTAPGLTLAGDAEMIVWLGSDFTDPGATSSDTLDGDIPVSSSEAVPQDRLVFHLDASTIVGKQTGDPVPVWYDKSPSANNADDVTGIPIYIANGINGHPVVHFDGNDSIAVTRAIDNRYTILTVSRMEGTQNYRLLTSKNQNWLMGYWNGYEDVFHTSGWATDQKNLATANPHLYTVTNNGKVMADARLFSNGVDVTDYPLRQRGYVGYFQMGGYYSDNSEASIGDVAEVIAYERLLTDGERRAVEAYLLGKYGLSSEVGISPVNTQKEGEYMVTYGSTDQTGNTTIKTRKVIVKMNPATPIITLAGDSILSHQAGTPFVDPGFTLATGVGDSLDASLVEVSGEVDHMKLSFYPIHYNYTDAGGNKAVERARYVTVVDTVPPAITLAGESTIRLQVGDAFEDPGAISTDNLDGDLSVFSSLNIPSDGLLGYWQFDEDAGVATLDSYRGQVGTLNNFDGNQWVAGKDGNALSFDGANDYLVLPVSSHPKGTDTQASFAFWSNGGTKLPRNSSVIESGAGGRVFNIHHPWRNSQIYWDAAGNRINKAATAAEFKGEWVHWTFTINRTSGVQEIYKNGVSWHQGTNKKAAWAQATLFHVGASLAKTNYWHGMIDNLAIYNRVVAVPEIQKLMVGMSLLDTSVPGTFLVTYSASDSNRNTSEAVRTIIVAEDLSIPFIALHGLPEVIHEAGSAFIDPGAKATSQDGTLLKDAILGTGDVDGNKLGEYSLTYAFTDAEGNDADAVSRKVTVVDTTPPSLALVAHPDFGGTDLVRMKAGQVYSDPGAVATDNLDAQVEVTDSLGIPDGLVAYYSFDDREYPGFEDTRNENEYPGKMIAGAGWTIAGKYGGGLAIPRAHGNARMEIGDSGIQLGAEWTVTSWFRELYPVGQWRTLFHGFTSDHQIIVGNAGDELGTFLNGRGDYLGSGFMMKTEDYQGWHHIAAVGKEGETHFYIDGRHVGKSTGISDTQIWQVGAYPGQRFASTLDEIAVFSTALDDAGVKVIMNSGKPLMTEFPGTYTVRYFAIDAQGNRSHAERTIVVEEDPDAPLLSLLGGVEVLSEAGSPFADPGVTVTNSAGEVIEGAVPEIDGAVDHTKLGEYELIYRYRNAADKPAVPMIRKVTIVDTSAPVITLVDGGNLSLPMGKPFNDPGATALDNLNGEVQVVSSMAFPQGLVLHLDAGSFKGKLQDGEAIGIPWEDGSGAENHADQRLGDPTWIAAGLNGEPVVRFDGNDLIWTTKNFQPDLTAYSIFSVARYSGGDSERVISSRNRNWLFGFHANLTQRFYAEGWIYDKGSSNTDWHTHVGTIDNEDRANFWADGLHLAVDSNAANNTNYKPAVIQLGGYNDAVQTSRCEVSELLLFNRVLEPVERMLVQEHLHTKYSLNGGGTFRFAALDMSVEGTNVIRYGASDTLGNLSQVTRTVEVVNDPLIPDITLLPNGDGDVDFSIEYGSEFTDPGATVADQDGNALNLSKLAVTGVVDSSRLGQYVLTYGYVDGTGRAAPTLKRIIMVQDTTPPDITFEGAETIGVPIGGTFEDPGATAKDLLDGDMKVLSSMTLPLHGLLAYWTFDETSGLEIRDSARGHIGVLNQFKGKYFVAGKEGNALSFDGVNDYIELPVAAHPKAEDMQATFAFWSKGGSFLPRNTSVLESANGATRVFNIHHPWSDGQVYWDAAGNRINKVAQVGQYKDNWVYWVFTINRETGEQKIYLNGQLWHTDTGRFAPWLQADTFILGSGIGKTNNWHGLIDNLAIYNRELSGTEISKLFTGNSPLNSLVAHWELDGDAVDASAKEHDGVIHNEATPVEDRLGQADSALLFDGSNYIEVPFSPDLNPVEFSFSLWVKPTVLDAIHGSPITSRDDSPQKGFILYKDPDNNWSGWTGQAIGWHQVAGMAAVADTWEHLVVTYGSGKLSLYSDGVLTASQDGGYVPNSAQPLRIGAGATESAATFQFKGAIDDVRIYDRALTEAEVVALDQPVEDTRHTVLYQTADFSGNVTTRERTVVFSSDTTPPVITLVGDTEVTINVDEEYVDEGAIASDEKDGNLTPFVDDRGTVDAVDTSTPGEYTITYDVSDFAGNPAVQVTRKVIVAAVATPWTSWFTETALSDRPEVDRLPEADPDLDGMPNLIEYALGGNPLSSDRDILPTLELSIDGKLQITYVRLKSTFDQSITYTAQLTEKLSSSWSTTGVTIHGALQGVSQAQLPDNKSFAASRYERVRATVDTSIENSSGKQFLRVQVEQKVD